MIPFVDLKAQYAAHQARDRRGRPAACSTAAQFMLGDRGRGVRAASSPAYCGAEHAIARQHRHRRPCTSRCSPPASARATRSSPCRSPSSRRSPAIRYAGATPVFVDIDPRRFTMDPAAARGGDHAADEGDPSGPPVRPAWPTWTPIMAIAAAPRPRRDRGRLPGARRRVQGPARRHASATSAASASIPARTSAPTARAARSSPTTPSYAGAVRLLRDWGQDGEVPPRAEGLQLPHGWHAGRRPRRQAASPGGMDGAPPRRRRPLRRASGGQGVGLPSKPAGPTTSTTFMRFRRRTATRGGGARRPSA